MGISLNIYEKSPYDDLGEIILESGFFDWGLASELIKQNCKNVNKHYDECPRSHKKDGCHLCDCSDSTYIKITYEQLLQFNKYVLTKNTNIINSFCLNKNNCNLNKECDLDCLKEKHRECIWINFS